MSAIIDALRAEVDDLRAEIFRCERLYEAAKAWCEAYDDDQSPEAWRVRGAVKALEQARCLHAVKEEVPGHDATPRLRTCHACGKLVP